MQIIDKSIQEITNDEKLNKSFLSARLNEINVDCKIFKGNFYSDSFNYFPITEKFESFSDLYNWQAKDSINHFFSKDFFDYLNNNKNDFQVIEDIFLLGSSPGDNFYTNLIHFLPRIFFIDQKEIKLAVHRNLSNKFRNFISNAFKKISKSVNFIYLDDNYYLFKNSYMPQFFSIQNSKIILNYFFNNDYNKKNNNLKVYISRQNMHYRNLINQDDVINFFKNNGFRIFDPNHFNIEEQIKIFSDAELIISPTGSNLANLIFCKAGTKVIEISPSLEKNYESQLSVRYKNLCKIADLKYNKILADPIKVKKHSDLAKKYITDKILNESNYYSDMIVKIKDLSKYIN